MKRLRSLVPDSPRCAKAAAWCGLALFGFFALGLLLRLGSMAFSRWQVLRSPEIVVDSDAAGIVPAIERYLRETMAPNYGGEWEHCVPLVEAVAVDIANFDDIRVRGEFRVYNYRLEGDTFHFVSGGNHPGLMHLRETEGILSVVSFDPVLDGSEYLPSAKRIFGKNFKAWQGLVADDEALEAARLQSLADFAARNLLPARYCQNPGCEPDPLPNAENALGGAGILPAETPHAEDAEIAR